MADSNAEFQEVLLGTGFGGITDVKMGPDGLLYILSFGFGKIFVISGQSTQVDFSVDFDDDAKSDIAVYRDGTWFILRSSDGGARRTGVERRRISRYRQTTMGMGRRTSQCTETVDGMFCVPQTACRRRWHGAEYHRIYR